MSDIRRFAYLESGEIFEADQDGNPITDGPPVCTFEDSGEGDLLGPLFASASELQEACEAAIRGLNEMTRNYIASLPDEYHDAMSQLETALARSRGDL